MSRIFSGFLTWMQEKAALVFVAATANRIHLLPAEIIRKGRFDQVFFVDLPNEEERKQIFGIHLKKNKCDVGRFDLVFLAKATNGWNGAEIEQAVISAVVDAYAETRSLNEDDLYRMISATVPLAVTMEEQIKAIRSWAHERALNASRADAALVDADACRHPEERSDEDPGLDCQRRRRVGILRCAQDDSAGALVGDGVRASQFRLGSRSGGRNGARNRRRPFHSSIRPVSVSNREASESVSRIAWSSGGV